MFFKKLLLLCFVTVQINALDFVGIDVSGGTLSINHQDKNIYNFGLSTGWKDEENKMSSGLTYKHIGTDSVADTLGVEISKGFNSLTWKNVNMQIYPFVKIGVGVSLVDYFSEDDDYKDNNQEKFYDSDDKQKKIYVSIGAGINLSLKKELDLYISYDRLFLLPMRDNMSVGSVGVVFKF